MFSKTHNLPRRLFFTDLYCIQPNWSEDSCGSFCWTADSYSWSAVWYDVSSLIAALLAHGLVIIHKTVLISPNHCQNIPPEWKMNYLNLQVKCTKPHLITTSNLYTGMNRDSHSFVSLTEEETDKNTNHISWTWRCLIFIYVSIWVLIKSLCSWCNCVHLSWQVVLKSMCACSYQLKGFSWFLIMISLVDRFFLQQSCQ